MPSEQIGTLAGSAPTDFYAERCEKDGGSGRTPGLSGPDNSRRKKIPTIGWYHQFPSRADFKSSVEAFLRVHRTLPTGNQIGL